MSFNGTFNANINHDMYYNTICLKTREVKTTHAKQITLQIEAFHPDKTHSSLLSKRRKEVSHKEVIRKWPISFRSSDQLYKTGVNYYVICLLSNILN